MNERQRGGQDGGSSDTWLHAAMRATLAGSGGCPDASEVAAFAEGRLDGTERERFERHAAGCPRCLELLGTLALIDERVVPAETGAAQKRAWWRWLVPATVAATAAGVYLLVQPAPPGQDAGAGNAGAEAPAYERAYEREAPASSDTRDAPAGSREAPSHTRDAPSEARGGAPASIDQQPAQEVVSDGRTNERRDQAAGGAAPAPLPAAPPAPAREEAFAPAPVLADQALTAPSKGVAASGESRAPVSPPAERELGKAEPAPDVQAEARVAPQAAAMRTSAGVRKDAVAIAHPVEASAPGGAERWRFGPGTAVSRSVDGGRSWVPGTTPASVTAASSPAPSTCWAVGRAGVVITTSDGETWRRVAFPAASDLVAVTAESATSATVRTASGASYTTRDGGTTWVAAHGK